MIKYSGYNISKWSGCLYDKSLVSLFNITRFLLLILLGLVHLIFRISSLDDIVEKMIVINYLILIVNSGLMSLPLIFNSEKNREFFEIIQTEFYQPDKKLSERQSAVQKSTNNFLRLFIKNVVFYYYFAMLVNIVRRPLLAKRTDENDFNSILIISGYLPFEVKSWFRYVLTAIVQSFIACNMVTAHLGMLLTFVIHAKLLCQQYEILAIYVEETFEIEYKGVTNRDRSKNEQRQQYIQYRVNSFIEQHIKLLKYFRLFQEMYSVFLLLFAISSGAMVCTVVYLITDPQSTTVVILIGVGCIFLAELIIMGTYCWFGQQVSDQCSRMSEVIYNTPWYTLSVKTQKTVLNILTVCQMKRIVKGGGVQEFSMKGLSELLHTSFSYFNMLKAMR